MRATQHSCLGPDLGPRLRNPLDLRRAVPEPGAEQDVGVVEHALLEGHDNELRAFEPRFEQLANVLRAGRLHPPPRAQGPRFAQTRHGQTSQ